MHLGDHRAPLPWVLVPMNAPANVASLDDHRRREEHRERWRNQRAAAGLLQGERVADCQRSLTSLGITIERDTETGRTGFAGVLCCDSRWLCPICAAKITERDRRELQRGIELWVKAGGAVYLVTQTFRHDVTLAIGDRVTPQEGGKRLDAKAILANAGGITRMQLAQKKMKGRRDYKAILAEAGAIGAVKALECTIGANGWHPHTHTLIFARPGMESVLEKIRPLWADAVRAVGLGEVNEHGFDVRGGDYAADYVAKFGKEPSEQSRQASRAWWTASHELTKGHTKQTARLKGATPFTLLRWYREGDAQAGALFVEYAKAFKGRAQLYWSPRLRKRIDLLELQEPPRPVAKREKVVTVSREDWAAVLRHDARWELLFVAERYGAAAVEALLSDMRRSRGRWSGKFRTSDPHGRMMAGYWTPMPTLAELAARLAA